MHFNTQKCSATREVFNHFWIELKLSKNAQIFHSLPSSVSPLCLEDRQSIAEKMQKQNIIHRLDERPTVRWDVQKAMCSQLATTTYYKTKDIIIFKHVTALLNDRYTE